MSKNWKYTVKSPDGEIIKGYITDTEQTAAQICLNFEIKGYEIYAISCITNFPFLNFYPKKERRNLIYA